MKEFEVRVAEARTVAACARQRALGSGDQGGARRTRESYGPERLQEFAANI